MSILTRSYDPNTGKIIQCATCGQDCTPFPHKDSQDCAMCAFIKRNPNWTMPKAL